MVEQCWEVAGGQACQPLPGLQTLGVLSSQARRHISTSYCAVIVPYYHVGFLGTLKVAFMYRSSEALSIGGDNIECGVDIYSI